MLQHTFDSLVRLFGEFSADDGSVIMLEIPSCPAREKFQEIKPKVEPILKRRGVRCSEFDLVVPHEHGQAAENDTRAILAEAIEGDQQIWSQAVEDIWMPFRNCCLKRAQECGITVEIMGEALTEEWHVSPVEPEHLLIRMSSGVGSEVLRPILRRARRSIQAINFFRYGPIANTSVERGTKKSPTIIVSILPSHS